MPIRNRPAGIARLLDRSIHPVYLVDDRGKILFANEALAEWTGAAVAELIGQVCQFHSGTGLPVPQAVACQLCPPPVAMAGIETTAELMFGATQQGGVRRVVRFLPLKSAANEVSGVLALAGDPITPADDQRILSRATAAKDLHERIQLLRHRFHQPYHIDRLLGATAAMSRVREQAALAAASRVSVNIVGPPGSGREQVARAIHSADPQRASEPLVPLACSLVSGELLRSTVAALLERGGPAQATLLLNDIDQLSPVDQADLPSLFAAASRKVRFVTTARAALTELARRGEFLTLAAHQLSALVIELPPLAERLEDLPLLAQLFLERANARGSKQVQSFSEESLDLLAAFPWTNDLDELEQVVIASHASCQGVEITAADLPPALRKATHAAAHPPKPEEAIDLEKFLARIELEIIERALAQARGNKSKAAQLLGLNRPRLYRRLVQLGLVTETEPTGDDSAEFEEAGP